MQLLILFFKSCIYNLNSRIQKLIDLSYTSDTMGIVASMKKIVPEFVSKNSEFEILDKASF